MATTINYVKFLRGTPAAFERLAAKDKDTLYFISEPGAKTGLLYLGDKLIAGGATGDISNISLEDLKDVIIDETGLADGSILMYDWAQQAWVNKTLDEVVVDVMEGASSSQAGTAGLVPAPKAGEQNKFLRGDGTWAEAGLTEEEKETLEDNASKLESLIGDSAKEDGSIPSVADIASEVLAKALIPEDAQESLDTLQEIAEWIQQHPGDVATINSKINVLEGKVETVEEALNGTDETTGLIANVTTLINEVENSESGLITKVGELEAILYDTQADDGSTKKGLVSVVRDLTNTEGAYVLNSVYQAQVGSIDKLNFTEETSTTIVDEINSINTRLRWIDMEEE